MDKIQQLYSSSRASLDITTPRNHTVSDTPSVDMIGKIYSGLITENAPYIDIQLDLVITSGATITDFGFLALLPDTIDIASGHYPPLTLEEYPKELFIAELKNYNLFQYSLYIPLIKLPYKCSIGTRIIHFFDYDFYVPDEVSLYVTPRYESLQ